MRNSGLSDLVKMPTLLAEWAGVAMGSSDSNGRAVTSAFSADGSVHVVF